MEFVVLYFGLPIITILLACKKTRKITIAFLLGVPTVALLLTLHGALR